MRYHYVTLSYQEKLGSGASRPFAVLVETRYGHERRVYVVGKKIPGDHESIMGEVLINLPEILRERLLASLAQASRQGGLALSRVRNEFKWNIRSSEPRFRLSLRSADKVAESLFRKYVEPESRPIADEDTAARQQNRYVFPVELAATA